MTIIHTNGIHLVKLRFCGCADAPEPWIQLLRNRMWPATRREPTTAFTLASLDLFQRLNLNGKLPAYAFHQALATMTDNSGIRKKTPKVRKTQIRCKLSFSYLLLQSREDQLALAVRMFRHIKALKRAGVGHHIDGINSISSGALCVECPACPHPGKNLPLDWRSMPEALQ
jgi:hypothetical protein